jgi:hypothetical protein
MVPMQSATIAKNSTTLSYINVGDSESLNEDETETPHTMVSYRRG